MAKLAQFKSKLDKVKMEDKKEKEADDSSWLTHELTFEVDPTKKVTPF